MSHPSRLRTRRNLTVAACVSWVAVQSRSPGRPFWSSGPTCWREQSTNGEGTGGRRGGILFHDASGNSTGEGSTDVSAGSWDSTDYRIDFAPQCQTELRRMSTGPTLQQPSPRFVAGSALALVAVLFSSILTMWMTRWSVSLLEAGVLALAAVWSGVMVFRHGRVPGS